MYKQTFTRNAEGTAICDKHNQPLKCNECQMEKLQLNGTICEDCGSRIQSWQHPAGHVICFCKCIPDHRLWSCTVCKKMFTGENDPHPHHIYKPNLKMFLKWGYMAN